MVSSKEAWRIANRKKACQSSMNSQAKNVEHYKQYRMIYYSKKVIAQSRDKLLTETNRLNVIKLQNKIYKHEGLIESLISK